MKSIFTYLLLWFILLPANASAWQWVDFWVTRDQQGYKLLQAGNAQAAAQIFKNKDWQSVSHYRAGNYAAAFTQFSANKTSDGQYNAGNAAAFMGHYSEAIAAYDKAIALNPKNHDAITNREIIKKLLQQQQQHNSQENSKKQNQVNQQKQPQQTTTSSNQQQLTNHPKPNQTDKSPQKTNDQEQQYRNLPDIVSSKQQRQKENNQQILQRLSDDAGGLLQQKFLRDYLRRHGAEGLN